MNIKNALDNLEKGHHLLVNDKGGTWQVFSPYKDKYGDYRISMFWNTKEGAIEHIGCDEGYTPEGLKEILQEAKSIEIYVPDYPLFEVGEEVIILPEAERELKKSKDWNDNIKKYIGKIGKVEARKKVKVKFEDDCWYFPHNCIAKPMMIEKEEEIEEMTMQEVCKELGREIKITK